jgi:hypothetical protein
MKNNTTKNLRSNTLLLLFTLIIGAISWGQTEKEIEKVADGTCECLKGKSNELKELSSSELQMELGLCMLAAMGSEGVDIDDISAGNMEAFGEKVGFQMAFSCPDFMAMIGQMIEEDPELVEEFMDDSDSEYYFGYASSAGSVLSVNTNEFVSLKLNSENGRKETYYWFEHFEGAHLLENDGAAIIGKEVIVEYDEIELYSPKLEDYTYVRMLRSLKIQ